MPHALYEALKLGPLKKTTEVFTTTCSIVSAAGIIEDVMVKVGRLVIPTDFHVIKPPPGERGHPQVLLGGPFLKTSGFRLTYADDIFTFSSGRTTETFQISPPPKKKSRQDDGRMRGKEAAQIRMIEALIRELLQKMREEKMTPIKVYPPPSRFSRRLVVLRARRARDEVGPANAAPQEDEGIDVSSDSDSEQVPEYVPGEGAANEQDDEEVPEYIPGEGTGVEEEEVPEYVPGAEPMEE
ncbi:hypothetical protein PIB30_052085 [Stylosanthes scabra]|uniref:Uncharacterized protein n=1 Tax=Stylosanthes scabra TaxID=79078 RepID=A0ABU6ZGU2_9FABA|nr:hypothetical protein [Stylosanthes scabra]